MSDLTGRKAIITGGGTGIGLACARKLSADGADVVLMGRKLDRLEAAAGEIPRARAIQCDVTSDDSVAAAFSAAGEVDILVNNAGIAASVPFKKMTMEEWRRLQAVNVEGVVRCTLQVFERMLGLDYARIVNIASIAGLGGGAYISHYVASKHAVVGLTRSLAEEAARKRLTVNAVCPGYVATEMAEYGIKNIMDARGVDREAAIAQLTQGNPQGRLIEVEEVAEAVAYICSPRSSSFNGETIAINGGQVG